MKLRSLLSEKHLMETIMESSIDHEPAVILRDKLVFLQDLLYANCITEDEYHASKRPLLQRIAVQGAKVRESDVIVGANNEISNEEWSVVDMEQRLVNPDSFFMSKNKLKEGSTIKNTKGDSSVSAFVSPDKNGKTKEDKDASACGSIRPRDRNTSTVRFSGNELAHSTENRFWNSCLNERESESKSILMKAEKQSGNDKGKKKPFGALFKLKQKDGVHGGRPSNENDPAFKDKEKIEIVKRWGFDGFKKWKKNEPEDKTGPLSLGKNSNDARNNGRIVTKTFEKRPNTKKIKKRLLHDGSQPDFFVYEVLGGNIKELSQIKAELSATSPCVHLSDDQIEEISIRHPVDIADLKKLFPESRCDGHGDAVLDVVREMGNSQVTAMEKRHDPKRWTTFDDEENTHPNLFAPQGHLYTSMKQDKFFSSSNECSYIF